MKKGKKWQNVAVLGFCALSLGGCSTFLEESYSSVTPHSMAPMSDDSSVVTVEGYYELVNALLYFVNMHMEGGQIRLVDYERDLANIHLEEAIDEVLADTALGSYGVASIEWELNYIIGNLEASVTVNFKKTVEDYENIIPLVGTSAIARRLTQSFTDFEEHLVIQNSYANNDRSQIAQVLHVAFSGAVKSLVAIPEVHTAFYPQEGPWRIVEFEFLYDIEEAELEQRQEALETALKEATSQLWSHSGMDMFQTLLENLSGMAEVGEGSTPYDVLVEGEGDSRGFALTYLALCREMGLTCQVVVGLVEEEVRYWNLVTLATGTTHHVDILREDEGFQYYSDLELEGLGYSWNRSVVGEATVYEPPTY